MDYQEYIDALFDSMIEDVKMVKRATYFMKKDA